MLLFFLLWNKNTKSWSFLDFFTLIYFDLALFFLNFLNTSLKNKQLLKHVESSICCDRAMPFAMKLSTFMLNSYCLLSISFPPFYNIASPQTTLLINVIFVWFLQRTENSFNISCGLYWRVKHQN